MPRIRAALIGTQHAHATGKLQTITKSADFELVGVCEPDAAVRARREKEQAYQGVRWLRLEQVLGDSSVPLVAIEGAVWENLEFAQKAIAAGKHVHLDKPPGNEMAPFRSLVDEARRKKLLLQVGYIWRNHEGFRAALNAARQGWLGDVYMWRGTINSDLPAKERAGPARYKGGMMFELGCHLVDRLVDFWGAPRDVRSWIRHDTPVPDSLGDNALAVFEYPRGLAVISSSCRMPGTPQHRSFEVIGTDGAIAIQPIEPGTKMRVSMQQPRGPYKQGWQEVEFPAQQRYVGDFRDLAHAIRTGEPLRHSYDHELLVQETLLRACGEQVRTR